MPGAYSTDLRERVLVAVEAGESPDVVAEEFMVGRSSVYRWIAAAGGEGRRAPKPLGGGPLLGLRWEGGGGGEGSAPPKADRWWSEADHPRRDRGGLAPPAGGEQ